MYSLFPHLHWVFVPSFTLTFFPLKINFERGIIWKSQGGSPYSVGGYQSPDDIVRMVGYQLRLCQFQDHPCPPSSSRHLTRQIPRWWEGMGGLGTDRAIRFITHHETSDDWVQAVLTVLENFAYMFSLPWLMKLSFDHLIHNSNMPHHLQEMFLIKKMPV